MKSIGWILIIFGLGVLYYNLKYGGTLDAGELVYNMGIDSDGFMGCKESIQDTKIYDEASQKKQMFYVLISIATTLVGIIFLSFKDKS